MARNKKRKTVSYDKVKAVEKVLSDEMGYKKAAKHYDLKKKTIRDHVKKRYTKMGAGRNTAFSSNKEIELAECLNILTRWGFGLTRCKMKELVGEYISALGCEDPFTDNLPSYDWLASFLKLHPKLTFRVQEQLKKSWAKSAANKRILMSGFSCLKQH